MSPGERVHGLGRLLVVVAVILFFASSAASLDRPLERTPAPVSHSVWISRGVIGLKNLLLDALRFGQAGARAAVQWTLGRGRQGTSDSRVAPLAEPLRLEPAP